MIAYYLRLLRLSSTNIRSKPILAVIEVFQRQFADDFHGIIKSPLIEETFATPTGLGCTLVEPRVRAEVFVKGSNVLLGFGQPGRKLDLE